MANTKQLNGMRIANAIAASAFDYSGAPDQYAIERIRGARMDRAHRMHVDGALYQLLAHRADCGYVPPDANPLPRMVGGQQRIMANAIGRPHAAFYPEWMR